LRWAIVLLLTLGALRATPTHCAEPDPIYIRIGAAAPDSPGAFRNKWKTGAYLGIGGSQAANSLVSFQCDFNYARMGFVTDRGAEVTAGLGFGGGLLVRVSGRLSGFLEAGSVNGSTDGAGTRDGSTTIVPLCLGIRYW
jgi:hypothetical protein